MEGSALDSRFVCGKAVGPGWLALSSRRGLLFSQGPVAGRDGGGLRGARLALQCWRLVGAQHPHYPCRSCRLGLCWKRDGWWCPQIIRAHLLTHREVRQGAASRCVHRAPGWLVVVVLDDALRCRCRAQCPPVASIFRGVGGLAASRNYSAPCKVGLVTTRNNCMCL